MKTSPTLAAAFALTPAFALAHPGHVAPEAGHSHLLEFALMAFGAIAVAGIVRWALRRRSDGSPR